MGLGILSIERPSVLKFTAPERQSDHCAPRISPQRGETWPFCWAGNQFFFPVLFSFLFLHWPCSGLILHICRLPGKPQNFNALLLRRRNLRTRKQTLLDYNEDSGSFQYKLPWTQAFLAESQIFKLFKLLQRSWAKNKVRIATTANLHGNHEASLHVSGVVWGAICNSFHLASL